MENKTSYFGYQEKIRKANVEYKDFVYTNFWSVLMHYILSSNWFESYCKKQNVSNVL